jgi:hypothetical protein
MPDQLSPTLLPGGVSVALLQLLACRPPTRQQMPVIAFYTSRLCTVLSTDTQT